MQIETWSDIVCPFCVIGKKNLDKVINELAIQNKVEIIPRSFQLEPSFPENSSASSISYLSSHKGYPAADVKTMCNDLTIQGRGLGIHFNFDAARMFNTLNAHRLVKWAQTFELDNELIDALMLAYSSKGIDLSQQINLLNVVKSVGLNEGIAKEVLNSNDFSSDISKDRTLALNLQLSGVPYYKVNGKFIIAGVQSFDMIKKTLKAALNDLESIPPLEDASACSIDGDCV